MRIQRKWVVAAIATLFTLLAAVSAFASKPKKPKTAEPPAPIVSTADPVDAAVSPATADSQDDTGDLMITLRLNPGADESDPQVHKVSMPVPDYLQDKAEQERQKIKDVAMDLIGTPYRWGGTTPAAFDCSGFTRYVYKKVGVSLPRTAREQYQTGKKVKAGSWKLGDLVFFDMSKGYVSHVGMYLSQFAFIHASTPRTGVRIDSLKVGSFRKHYVGARRYCAI